MFPDFRESIAFRRCSGFGRLSFRDEHYTYEDDYGEMVENTDRGKPEYLEKNLSQCKFVRNRPHLGWLGMELGRPWLRAGHQPRKTWHYLRKQIHPLCSEYSVLPSDKPFGQCFN